LLNVQQGEGSGQAVRVRNPSSERTLDFFVPTTNASGIRFTYAVQRSNAGMLENIFSYSLDGENFISDGLSDNIIEVTTAYELHTIDFSEISGANNNPDFRIRISFEGNTVAASGNNRLDNITLMADNYLIIESESLIQVVVYPNPTDNLLNVQTTGELKMITVLDMSGRVLLTSTNPSLNVNDLNAGVYLVLIQTNEGTVQRTFVKK